MIADRGPNRCATQQLREKVEYICLIIGVGAVIIGIVAEHQPHIGVAPAGVAVIGVTHSLWVAPVSETIGLVDRAAIANGPDAGGFGRRRGGNEEIILTSGQTTR